MEAHTNWLLSGEVDADEMNENRSGKVAEDEDKLNTSSGSPILNTPTIELKNRNKARRRTQQMSKCCKESVAIEKVGSSSTMSGENELQTDFIVPKTPVQRAALQTSQICCESDSEDLFASDTSECGEENFPSNINALLSGPEPSNLSWTSSMATPVAGNVTWSNLNTEERKVFLPSEDCNILGVKPRALFTPDLNDTAECHSLNISPDKAEMNNVTPKLLQRRSTTGHKISIDTPLAMHSSPHNMSAFAQQVDEGIEKVISGSPILSGSGEYKKTPAQYEEIFPEENDLFDNVESIDGIISCNETTKENSAAESTPNPESRGRSPLSREKEFVESELIELVTSNSSEKASRAQKRDNSAISSTPGKHLDAKRRRLLFSSCDTTINSPKLLFKAPETKLHDDAVLNHVEDIAAELIPDDSFSEHLAAMNTSIFSDPIAPLTKVQAIKSSVSHMKKFCYTIDERKSVPDDKKACLPTTPQDLMEEIIKSVLAQETAKAVTVKDKPVLPSGDLIVFSQMVSKEEDQTGNKLEATEAPGLSLMLKNNDTLVDLQTEGFQTASGHSIEISHAALTKGLHCLKGAMEDGDTEPAKISPKLDKGGDSFTIPKASCLRINSRQLKDDEILQEEEEVKQLLQLVKSGEDFDVWHENEQPLPDNLEEPKATVATVNASLFPSRSELVEEGKPSELESHAPGFSTASGRNIFISETNLAKARKLFELEDQPVDLVEEEHLKSLKTFEAKNSSFTSFTKSTNIASESKNAISHKACYPKAEEIQSSLHTEHEILHSKEEIDKEIVLLGHDNICSKILNHGSTSLKCEESSVCSDSNPEVSNEIKISSEALSFLTNLMDNRSRGCSSAPTCETSGSDGKTINGSAGTSTEIRHSLNVFDGGAAAASTSNDKKHFVEVHQDKENILLKSEATSFTTASGKTVVVSKEALKKVETLFNDLNENEDIEERKKSAKLSGDMDQKVVDLHFASKHESLTIAMTNTETLTPTKFTLQSKSNSVHISSSSLKGRVPENSFTSAQKSCSDGKAETEHFLERGEGKLAFSSGSGRAVNVSRESLKKVKGLFDDVSSASVSKKGSSDMDMVTENFVAGFSTASGKFVSVGKEALSKAKKLFDGVSSEDENLSVEPETIPGEVFNSKEDHIPGFCTASGKSVSVSEIAVEKVKGLFDAELTSLDLQTLLSSESFKTECLVGSMVESNSGGADSPSVPMAGFSTAGGKNVHISKKALNKAKELFEDLNSESQVILSEHAKFVKGQVSDGQRCPNKNGVSSSLCLKKMAGFATAGGKDVLISEEALSKAKHLFDDFEAESLVTLSEKTILQKDGSVHEQSRSFVSKASSSSAVKMSGFSTAGGREVHISEDAISKAKTLFIENPSDENTLLSSNPNKTVDDSGVFLSHENTPSELSLNRSVKAIELTSKKVTNTVHLSNKDNQNVDLPSFQRTVSLDGLKESLTQEISESTAALLADEADTVTNTLPTICTSPSMVTDRCCNMKPILTSASGNSLELHEPTSPILMKTDNKRRSRRGRLSLSNMSVRGSSSPTLGSQTASSQNSLRRARISIAATHPSATDSGSAFEGDKKYRDSDRRESAHHISQVADVQPSPLRKLFADDITPLSSEVLAQTCDAKDRTLAEPVPQSSSSPGKEASHVAKPSPSIPLVQRVLNRNLTSHSTGFKTPYKQACKEQQKRTPPSPLSNPPVSKRRRSSTNLYASHNFVVSLEQAKLGSRILRPEVEEMRRRAAEEQRQLAENYTELKGELLEPCVGSWLASKTSDGMPKLKLAQLGLPGTFSSHHLLKIGLRNSTVVVTSENARDFRFSAWDYYSEDMCRENVAGLPVGDGAYLVLDSAGTAGVEEVERSFLASPGVDPSLLPPNWIKNHFRWLVWKLAAYEWRFPDRFGQRCLSPHMLMLQLKYRYDREIDRCERPALRRIFEHDDSPAKRMVLCVASVIKPKDDNQSGNGLELELTDGWYSIIALIDQDMQHRVRKGVICVGTKLVIHGAELINCPDGCFPLQARPEVRLKIHSNSTRRSKWYAKLGFQDNPGPIRVVLSSILCSGGVISCVSAYVARVYPIIFMQKTGEKTVVRSQRAESKEVAKCEKKRQQEAELLYNKFQTEVHKERSKRRPSSVKLSLKYVSSLTSGEDLIELLENSSDPISVQSMLTEDQKSIVSDYQCRRQEELCQEVENRVRLHLSENSQHDRNVTPILKIRLVDSSKGKQSSCAMLSVYRPSEDISSIFKEGHKLSIFGAVANGLRCGELQLSANRSTRYCEESSTDIIPGLARSITPLNFLLSHGFLPRFGEFDIVGFIVSVSPAPRTSENSTHFQTVYVSDSQMNIIGISFREGVKEFGVEDLLVPHTSVVASNLQWRGGPIVRALPCVFASELSAFTSNPRQKYFQAALQDLRSSLPSDLKSFCRSASEKLDLLLKQKVPMAIGSPRTPDPIVSKPEEVSSTNQSISIVNTPTSAKSQQHLSLEKQLYTPSCSNSLSPAVEKKIARLEMYGEPPPISPILGSQTRKTRSSFKPPRRTDSPQLGCKKSYLNGADN